MGAEEAEVRLSPGEGLLRDDIRALREPMDRLDKALHDGTLRDELRSILRELRGELTGIRARLDSLVAIEKELAYQGQRLTAIEKRFGTMVETKFEAPPGAA